MKPGALLIAALLITQPSPADAILAKLDAYLAAYEPRLSELIADETMKQEARRLELFQPSDAYRGQRWTRVRRKMTSEVAFISLPGNGAWIGFRRVKTVNAQPVDTGDASLRSTLTAKAYDAALALATASAAHNLGLLRTTNLPNLPLEFLHPRNRHRLLPRLDGQETVRGTRVVRVVLIERMTPTLIRNPNTDADMPGVVRAWIDPQTGRLLRAEVSIFTSHLAKNPENNLRIEFGEDKSLGLLVPKEMREAFPADDGGTGTGVATYSNFRKFQTSARIVQ